MDNAVMGFLLGAVPGVVFALRNMLGHLRTVDRARKMVQERGERFDYRDDLSAMNNISFKSSEFIRPTDGAAIREAKEMLLASRDTLIFKHIRALFVMMGGALIGAFLGGLSKLLIGS